MAGKKSSQGDMVLGGGHLVGIFALLVIVLGVVFTLGYVMGRGQFEGQLNPSVEAAIRRVDGLMGKPEKAGPESEQPIADEPKTASAKAPRELREPKATKEAPDFYHAGQSKAPERLEEPAKPVAVKARAAAPPSLKAAEPRANAASSRVAAAPDGELVPVKAEVPAKADAPTAKAEVPAKVAAKATAASPKSDGSFRPGVPLNAPPIAAGATVLQVAALVREADALMMAQALQQKGFPAFVLTPANDQFYRVQVGPYSNVQAANTARQGLEKQGFKSIVKR